MQRRDRLPALFRAAPRLGPVEVVVDQVGLNHLTWIRAVHVGGRDVLPELLAEHGEAIAEQAALPLRLLEELGVVPSSYLQYFYRHDAIVAEQLEATPRAEVVAEIERGLLELYRDPNLNEKPALLEQRGGAFYSEAATEARLVARLGRRRRPRGRRPQQRHLGRSPTTTSSSCRHASRPAASCRSRNTRLRRSCSGLTQHVAAYERLAAQAAVSGDPALAHRRCSLTRSSASTPSTRSSSSACSPPRPVTV